MAQLQIHFQKLAGGSGPAHRPLAGGGAGRDGQIFHCWDHWAKPEGRQQLHCSRASLSIFSCPSTQDSVWWRATDAVRSGGRAV